MGKVTYLLTCEISKGRHPAVKTLYRAYYYFYGSKFLLLWIPSCQPPVGGQHLQGECFHTLSTGHLHPPSGHGSVVWSPGGFQSSPLLNPSVCPPVCVCSVMDDIVCSCELRTHSLSASTARWWPTLPSDGRWVRGQARREHTEATLWQGNTDVRNPPPLHCWVNCSQPRKGGEVI